MFFAETRGYGLVRLQGKQWDNAARPPGVGAAAVGCCVVYWPVMTAKETTLDTILATVERGFAAVVSDIGEMKSEIREIKFAMATKEDVRTIVNEEVGPIRSVIRDELDDLSEKFANVSGFRKEIDHALERIAAIEKRLRDDKRIAA
jgi:DNA-binding PucR family transcriptional regulator